MAQNVREPLYSLYAKVKEHKAFITSLFIAALGLLAFGVNWHYIIIFPLLFLAATFSTFYKRIIKVPPAFELISLTTVAVGMSHGAFAGALFGSAATLAAEIVNGSIDAFIIGYVFARAVMGALAAVFATLFPTLSFLMAGMALLGIFNVIAQSLYFLQGDVGARMKLASYLLFNFIINWWLFSALGAPLLGLLR